MAKATDVRPKITLACRSASTATTSPGRTGATTRTGIELKKFCPHCDNAHGHRETRLAVRSWPLDQSFVGRSYPPTAPYEVGREKIREFADAIGDDRPGVPRPGGRAGARLPGRDRPADVRASCCPWPPAGRSSHDPELGLDYSRVVHGEQRFVYARPVRAGDRLTVTVDRGEHPGRGRQRHAHHPRRGVHGRAASRCSPRTRRWSRAAPREADMVRYDEVEVGTELPAQTFPVHRAEPGAVRGRLRRLQPDPLERAVRHRGRPART